MWRHGVRRIDKKIFCLCRSRRLLLARRLNGLDLVATSVKIFRCLPREYTKSECMKVKLAVEQLILKRVESCGWWLRWLINREIDLNQRVRRERRVGNRRKICSRYEWHTTERGLPQSYLVGGHFLVHRSGVGTGTRRRGGGGMAEGRDSGGEGGDGRERDDGEEGE